MFQLVRYIDKIYGREFLMDLMKDDYHNDFFRLLWYQNLRKQDFYSRLYLFLIKPNNNGEKARICKKGYLIRYIKNVQELNELMEEDLKGKKKNETK